MPFFFGFGCGLYVMLAVGTLLGVFDWSPGWVAFFLLIIAADMGLTALKWATAP